MIPRKKVRNLRSSNCCKCIQIVNLNTTTLFLYHFKSFTIPSGGPFWLLGEGVRAHPMHPPAYGPVVGNISLIFGEYFNRKARLNYTWRSMLFSIRF